MIRSIFYTASTISWNAKFYARAWKMFLEEKYADVKTKITTGCKCKQ